MTVKKLALLISVVLMFTSVSAQSDSNTEGLSDFLAAVKNSPGVRANEALLQAAQARLDGAYSPVAFTGTGGGALLNISGLPDTLPPEVDIPDSSLQIDLGLSFRPFVFGDIADLAEQQSIELVRAQLGYSETLAALEAQAIEAALSLELAEAAADVAAEALALSQTGLEVTQTRFERGAATSAELRDSEQRLLEAQNALLSAQANVTVAQQGLRVLVGEAAVPEGLAALLEPVDGVPPAVLRAQLDVALAKVGLANSNRAFIPTAQASYAIPLEDKKSEITFSLESRTLQPSVNYNYQDPRNSFGGQSLPAGVAELAPDAKLNGTFSIGVSISLSGATFANRDAAAAQLAAAEAGLQSAIEQMPVTTLQLNNALDTARRSVAAADTALLNAQMNLEDASARLEAGLATQLQVDQARLTVGQARLGLRQAQLELNRSILNTYRSYAVPPSSLLISSDPSEAE